MNPRYYLSYPNNILYTNEDTLLDIALNNSSRESELKRTPNINLLIKGIKCSAVEEKKECSICQEQLRIHEKISQLTSCDHVYHYSCISEWGKYKSHCPLCRKKIPILER